MNVAVTMDNKPMCSILLFAIDDDFTMHFITHESTFKARALEKNPSISYSVWKHGHMYVQADGTVSKVTDPEEIDQAMDKIVNSADNIEDFWPPVLRVRNKSNYVVYKVKPYWLRASDLQSKKIREKEPTHTELKFNKE